LYKNLYKPLQTFTKGLFSPNTSLVYLSQSQNQKEEFDLFKKGISILALMSIMIFALAGCGGVDPVDPVDGDTLNGSITIAGSTSVAPIAEILAEEFMGLHPDVQIHVQSSGSSAGIKAAQENAADIGMSSRELKTEEKNIHEIVIAKDGIVIVVHKSNTAVSDISIEQIRKIFTGEITNWSEVGGQDVAIIAVTRETGSGTRGAFEDIVMNKQEISSSAIVQGSTGAVKTAVQNDPNAIGYISLATLDNSVRDLTVEGVKGTAENVRDNSYKIARPFLFLTNKAPEGLVKAFIEFILSPEGQSLVAEEGLIPVK
jgi:phosphate transport system substrate-binding protein